MKMQLLLLILLQLFLVESPFNPKLSGLQLKVKPGMNWRHLASSIDTYYAGVYRRWKIWKSDIGENLLKNRRELNNRKRRTLGDGQKQLTKDMAYCTGGGGTRSVTGEESCACLKKRSIIGQAEKFDQCCDEMIHGKSNGSETGNDTAAAPPSSGANENPNRPPKKPEGAESKPPSKPEPKNPKKPSPPDKPSAGDKPASPDQPSPPDNPAPPDKPPNQPADERSPPESPNEKPSPPSAPDAAKPPPAPDAANPPPAPDAPSPPSAPDAANPPPAPDAANPPPAPDAPSPPSAPDAANPPPAPDAANPPPAPDAPSPPSAPDPANNPPPPNADPGNAGPTGNDPNDPNATPPGKFKRWVGSALEFLGMQFSFWTRKRQDLPSGLPPGAADKLPPGAKDKIPGGGKKPEMPGGGGKNGTKGPKLSPEMAKKVQKFLICTEMDQMKQGGRGYKFTDFAGSSQIQTFLDRFIEMFVALLSLLKILTVINYEIMFYFAGYYTVVDHYDLQNL